MTGLRALAAAALVGALLGAPPASAGHERAECGFHSVSRAEVTGAGTYTGFAYGYVLAPGDTPTIRCEIRVNGVPAAATPTSDATPDAAVTAGQVTFTAHHYDLVWVCAVYTTRHGESPCSDRLPSEFPPPVVWDTLSSVLGVADTVVCEALKPLHPGTGPVYVNEQGDLYVAGEPQWDCPPYDIWPS